MATIARRLNGPIEAPDGAQRRNRQIVVVRGVSAETPDAITLDWKTDRMRLVRVNRLI
jgi:hypothetical protein